MLVSGSDPQDCNGDVHHGVCGGGARDVGFSEQIRENPFLLTPFASPRTQAKQILRGPNWALFCPEIRAFTGFGARFLQPFPKSLVTVRHYSNTKMAVNSR